MKDEKKNPGFVLSYSATGGSRVVLRSYTNKPYSVWRVPWMLARLWTQAEFSAVHHQVCGGCAIVRIAGTTAVADTGLLARVSGLK
jgi:hypothetical protein